MTTNVSLPGFTPLLSYRVLRERVVSEFILDPGLWRGPEFALYARTIAGDPTVLYVGKTRRGLEARLREHLRYLRPGCSRAQEWKEFAEGKETVIWGKASTIDTYLSEENRLIRTLRPRFNKRID